MFDFLKKSMEIYSVFIIMRYRQNEFSEITPFMFEDLPNPTVV